ncbi:MAG: sigma-70 family RNA polymerase sigma factor [Pseudomonadota bacterium]
MSIDTREPALKTFLQERELLISVACSIVQSRAIAEELVQDSWLRWIERTYPDDKALPIFRRIVANLARDWYRRKRTETLVLSAQAHEPQYQLDTERVVIARQDLAIIVSALESLPSRNVAAFRMSRVDGLTYAEIAKRMDTVPSRIHGYVVKTLAHLTVCLME